MQGGGGGNAQKEECLVNYLLPGCTTTIDLGLCGIPLLSEVVHLHVMCCKRLQLTHCATTHGAPVPQVGKRA